MSVTEEKIQEIMQKSAGHAYPLYVKNLKQIGVKAYEVDLEHAGNTLFFGEKGEKILIEGGFENLICNDIFNQQHIITAIQRNQEGLTDFGGFLHEIAKSGVHAYYADLKNMEVTYKGLQSLEECMEKIPEHI